jgi:sulfatase maturation enzyme AslB (radical SAM superfamily)
MDAKTALTDGTFCPMPWTGLMYNFDGSVKNCIRSADTIGNIKDQSIEEILQGPSNLDTQSRMLISQPGQNCYTCYDLENGKKKFDIASDRIFYIRELKNTSFDVYKSGNHDLQTVDVRWSNLCNFSCVYCGPNFSSKWAGELGIKQATPTLEQIERFKTYVFDRAHQLKHVYMAGGEPLLMKENLELLEILKRENPKVNLRINTNLSKVDTRVFELICGFKNVHWTISVESMADQFEYIRYGGSWTDFEDNLKTITSLPHRISFNMLYFLLNHRSFFDCVDWLLSKGYHPNTYIAGALLAPVYLNIRHLPDHVLQSTKQILMDRINQRPGYLLEDSYQNLLHYIDQPFEKNLSGSLLRLQELDARRGIDSKTVFKELYNLI